MGEHNELKNRYMLVNPPEEWKEPTSTPQVPHKYPASTGQVPVQEDSQLSDLLHTNNNNIVKVVLAIGEDEVSVGGMMQTLCLKDRKNFISLYLNPAIADGYVRLLYPQSPRHPRQRYLLTAKGLALFQEVQ